MFHFNNAIKMLYKARYKTFYETLIKLKIKEILRSSFWYYREEKRLI